MTVTFCALRAAAAAAEAAAAGPDEAGLELLGLVAGADFGQVAGGGMAVVAAAGAVEIGLAGLGVAGDHVETLVEPAIGHQFHLHVQELGDIVELILGEGGEGWHAFVGAALGDDGAYGFTLQVVQHHLGADQIGAGRAAGLIAVAEPATGGVELFPAGGGGGIGRADRAPGSRGCCRVHRRPRPPAPRPAAGGISSCARSGRAAAAIKQAASRQAKSRMERYMVPLRITRIYQDWRTPGGLFRGGCLTVLGNASARIRSRLGNPCELSATVSEPRPSGSGFGRKSPNG